MVPDTLMWQAAIRQHQDNCQNSCLQLCGHWRCTLFNQQSQSRSTLNIWNLLRYLFTTRSACMPWSNFKSQLSSWERFGCSLQGRIENKELTWFWNIKHVEFIAAMGDWWVGNHRTWGGDRWHFGSVAARSLSRKCCSWKGFLVPWFLPGWLDPLVQPSCQSRIT